jgi:ketosteroid isomerase-like protein
MSAAPQTMIRELENRRFRAMCEGDAATLEALLADGLVYTHSSANVDTKASYLAGIRSKKWIYKRVERAAEDIQVHGNCAIVTGEAHIDVAVGGTDKTLRSRYTNVWINGGKGWQMTAWQSTPIPAKA